MKHEIAVIGGSGFIGSRLCLRLSNSGVIFKIIDKVRGNYFPHLTAIADVRSVDDLRKSVPTRVVLINLAAEHRDDVRPATLYDEVNIEGAKNICEIANEKSVNTIIFTSTVAVYGFAPVGTNESGRIAPFNDYGRTKYEAELVYRAWQQEAPEERSLIIIRPTVVFGEQNRGNVYNLLKYIASGKFMMVGAGANRKSMAYVENVAAFIEYSIGLRPGVHVYNYVDKPDFSMNELVSKVNGILGRSEAISVRVPYLLAYVFGKCFDILSLVTGKKFVVSSIRVKKFCANSVYNTSVTNAGFLPPVPLAQALENTVRYEFLENHENRIIFHSE